MATSKIAALFGATALVSLTSASLAWAQAAPAESSVDAVVVTGSRLGQTGFTTPTPVTVVGQEQIATRALANIGEVLNEQPAFRNSTSPSQAQRTLGGGGFTLDLRGLGAPRTLTLVNGQRFVPTFAAGSLDVSLIPSLLVKRIDVVTGGASAAYGSDAVAGVVNFVTDNTMEGFRARAQYNVSEEGDNDGPLLSLAYGKRLAGGSAHVVAGAEYSKSDGVGRITERGWGARLPGLIAFGANRAPGLPASGFAAGVTYANQSQGGVVTSGPLRGTTFESNGGTSTFNYGTTYSSLMIGGSNPGGSPFGNWPLVAPVERYAGMVRAQYDVSSDTRVFSEINFGSSKANGFTSYNQRALIINRDNPYLPASVRNAMVANNLQTITVGRLLAEREGLQQENVRSTLRALVGVEGRVADRWDWDISVQQGRSKNDTMIFSSTLGSNYDAAAYAVLSPTGQIVCGPFASNPNLTPAKIARLTNEACVPLNIFGKGSPSQAALDYILEDSPVKSTYDRTALAASVRGSLFTLPAGDVQVALGGEYRKDKVNNVGNDYGVRGLFDSGNGGSYGGSQSVSEGFFEVGVPLLADQPLAKSLDLNAAARYTDYSTSGSVTTWKVGLTYEPNDVLRLRGTASRDIRAPNLGELYATTAPGVSVASAVNPFNGRTGQLITSLDGNLNLRPEIAKTYTGGVVFSPDWDWSRGLRLSVDAYSIDVDDVITTLLPAEYVSRCFAGAREYCPAVEFDNSNFGIANVRRSPVNLSRLQARGFDFEVVYQVPSEVLRVPGNMTVRLLANNVRNLKTTDQFSSVERAGALQGNGTPKWTANLNVNYVLDRLSLNVGARYFSGSLFDAQFVGPDSANYDPKAGNSINDNTFPSAVYVNTTISYDLDLWDRKVKAFVGIDNLLNRDPPQFAAIAINSGGNPYDLIGRRYQVGLRTAF